MAIGDRVRSSEATGERMLVEVETTDGHRVFVEGHTLVDTAGTPINMSGSTPHYLAASAATQNETSLKDSAGFLDGAKAENTAAYDVYVLFFDTAADPVVGTDTAVAAWKIKAGTISAYDTPIGVTFENGIGYAVVKDDYATAVAAGDLIDLEIYYR